MVGQEDRDGRSKGPRGLARVYCPVCCNAGRALSRPKRVGGFPNTDSLTLAKGEHVNDVQKWTEVHFISI